MPRADSRDLKTSFTAHLCRGVVLIALFHRWRRRAPRTPENWSISYVLILVFHSTFYFTDYHLPRWGSPAQVCPLEPPLQLWGLVVIIVTLCVVEDIEVLLSSASSDSLLTLTSLSARCHGYFFISTLRLLRIGCLEMLTGVGKKGVLFLLGPSVLAIEALTSLVQGWRRHCSSCS